MFTDHCKRYVSLLADELTQVKFYTFKVDLETLQIQADNYVAYNSRKDIANKSVMIAIIDTTHRN